MGHIRGRKISFVSEGSRPDLTMNVLSSRLPQGKGMVQYICTVTALASVRAASLEVSFEFSIALIVEFMLSQVDRVASSVNGDVLTLYQINPDPHSTDKGRNPIASSYNNVFLSPLIDFVTTYVHCTRMYSTYICQSLSHFVSCQWSRVFCL